MNLYGVLEIANVIVNIDGAFGRTEKNSATVGGPFNNLELDLKLLAPKAGSFDGPDDNCAIFVDNANLFTVGSPPHVGDYRLVSVVNHFFEPVLLVHHPHNDETLLVTRSQLLVLIVPLNDDHIALVALQVLVHAEIAAALAFS